MKLKLNKEIKVKAWHNGKVITDGNWDVYSEQQDDDLFIFVKNASSNEELKLKIEKNIIIEEVKEKTTE